MNGKYGGKRCLHPFDLQVYANLVSSHPSVNWLLEQGYDKVTLGFVLYLHECSEMKSEHVCKGQESFIVSPYQTGQLSIENLDPTQMYILLGQSLLRG